ncbi:efflux transporter periplasmic adaptor subunit [Sphingobium yanoikuyae]|uniref:Efflux transporter periplasmic adaptor subunit n=1 Tax=Sphingobium yanoikuyae TaxID=13690 RepID=A0A177JUU1_SPHYA|nr:efflux RND transporter periplasmic adaptor subunit [Sphingobium yanoikuyae]OAH44684.1 efflux transporter periplasmic adaptor subunit [Sphingobium yanoikuyae]
MTPTDLIPRTPVGRAVILAILASGAIGFGVARLTEQAPPAASSSSAATDERKILYWYDPMTPTAHFDKPGKSPFMDMQLVPRYADGAGGNTDAAPAVSIDSAQLQRLGARIVAAERGPLPSGITATGSLDFNQRDVAVVQARSGGFVQRVYARAPNDIVAAGAPIADLLVPEWGGAQAEYLAVRRTGDAALAQAARQRLALLGMPPSMIAAVDRSGRPRNVMTITTPVGGVIKTLNVHAGMTLAQGQTLAEVNGLGTVWLNAAVPEANSARLRIGAPARASFAGFPGETFTGRVTAVLPQADMASHTLTVRIELPNRGGRLLPGMFATVTLGDGMREALLVPSEALIRTGTRTLVMLAGDGGRFRPAEVQSGAEAGGRTEILAGLSEGEKVVASGQFLIDSEASLSGIAARPIGGASTEAPAGKAATVYETTGRIEQIAAGSITLSHQPVPALGWPAMTMSFALPNPVLAKGLKTGDQVRFGFDQPPSGPTIRRMTKVVGQ